MSPATTTSWPVCECCGERLGAYEPLLVERANRVAERTSLLGLRDRVLPAGSRVIHVACDSAPLASRAGAA